MMRYRILIIISFLFVHWTSLSAQQNDIDGFTRLYNYYCGQKLYTNASNILVEKAYEYIEQGDTLSAYELQLKNCHLTDEHLAYFFQNGLTWNDYFSNWYVTISWAAWSNKKTEIASELLRIIEMVSQKEPKLLPFFASSLSYVLYDYKVDNDSILVLQKALDYIKSVAPSQDLINQFNTITRCFYANRYANSFDKVRFIENHFNEIEPWYLNNHQYISSLDTTLFKREILEYELQFVHQAMLYASTINSQEGKSYEAIETYAKAISTLEPLVLYNDTIAQIIATCYSHIASIYFSLGDNALCKVYSDKALPFLIKHKDDFDYCDILNTLSFTFFNTNQACLAAQLKLEEIALRERLGWHCSLVDWAVYFLFAQKCNPKDIIESVDFALRYAEEPVGGCPDFYLQVGEAYTSLMDEMPHYKDSAELNIRRADIDFTQNEYFYDKYKLSDNYKYNYNQAWAQYYLKLRDFHKSYDFYKKALRFIPEKKYVHYYNVALQSSFLHLIDDIHFYLPRYYAGLEDELQKMLPILGSMESDTYLDNGNSDLYHIPEWASWNPTDSVCVCIAYDALLLIKGLTLRYNTLSPYYEIHPEIINSKLELDRMRDSIYAISNDEERLLALHRYELKEREVLRDVNHELTNVHWEDVVQALKENEACIEFVKYIANSYSWSDNVPTSHYAALILLPNTSTPFFIDLFDEDELVETYNLQPKSYDNEAGHVLYSKIWDKIHPYIKAKDKVFFSPMGLMNLMNIELLTDCNGRTAAENYNLYRVSSTRKIITRRDYRDIHNVVSFGGIDYEDAQEYAKVMNDINTRGNWAYLQNTLFETERIDHLLTGKGVNVVSYTQSNATEDAFKHLDESKIDVVHVASHGYYIHPSRRASIPYFANSENTRTIPDELFYSGIILSGGQKAWIEKTFEPSNNDGILSSYEISKLDLHNVRLVVLSACETALGDNLFDGIYGLQRAFKKAGVESILMSLWKIDDKATAEYMSLFYEKIADGCSPHEAYMSTVLLMKEKYKDPYYWASFILLD